MDIAIFHNKLSALYKCYNEAIKPLIADIESKYQKFPDSIFNEIRAFNDHVARCYISNITEERIGEEIEKAESHIVRITLDCYKYLTLWLYDYFNLFKANFDINLIDNGEFAPFFFETQMKGAKTLREAKQNESYDKQIAYNKYQEAYNIYSELYTRIEDHFPKILWAKKAWKFRIKENVLLIIVSAVLGAVLTSIPWKDLYNWFASLLS